MITIGIVVWLVALAVAGYAWSHTSLERFGWVVLALNLITLSLLLVAWYLTLPGLAVALVGIPAGFAALAVHLLGPTIFAGWLNNRHRPSYRRINV